MIHRSKIDFLLQETVTRIVIRIALVYGRRLTPREIDEVTQVVGPSLEEARRIGALHPAPEDPRVTEESIRDTQPGFKKPEPAR